MSNHIAQLIKGGSSKWVHDTFPEHRLFQWQEKYGSFNVRVSQLDTLIRYIRKQEQHHRNITFQEEFLALLRKHRIDFDERYLWDRVQQSLRDSICSHVFSAVNCQAIIDSPFGTTTAAILAAVEGGISPPGMGTLNAEATTHPAGAARGRRVAPLTVCGRNASAGARRVSAR